jgi:hypothetical protein
MEKRTISAHFKAVKSNLCVQLVPEALSHVKATKSDACVQLRPEALSHVKATRRADEAPAHLKAIKSDVCVQLVPGITQATDLCSITTPGTGLCNLSTLSPGTYFDGRLQLRVSEFSGFPNLMNVEDGVYGNITVKTLKRERGCEMIQNTRDQISEVGGPSQSQKFARKQLLARDALMIADPVAYFTSL